MKFNEQDRSGAVAPSLRSEPALERSEGSGPMGIEMLPLRKLRASAHCAQHDMTGFGC